MSAIIFKNINLFDGTGSALRPAEVRVEGNIITQVAGPGAISAEGGDTVIDGKGGTLMPGLIDVHTHLALGSSVEMINKPLDRSPEETALLSAHCGRVMLDHGYTGAFSGGSASVEGEIAVARAFEAGWVPGPRLITSSFERVPGGPMGLMVKFPGSGVRPSDPATVVHFVEEMADLGVQAVKFLLNGVSAFDPGANMRDQFHDEEVMAAGEAAARRGVWLTAHCYTAHAIKLAIKAGFRTLYHLTYADEEALDLVEAKKDKLFIGVAPGIVEADLVRAPRFGVMASDGQKEEQADAADRVKALGQALRARGVKSLPGGDYGFPWNPVGTNARDLELFVDWFGYTPAETLTAATKLGGEAMGLEGKLGVIAQGWLADMLVVSGDPTANISLLRDKANLKVILKDGKLYKNV